MLIYGGPTWPNWGKRIAENPSTVPGSKTSEIRGFLTTLNMNKDPTEQMKMRADRYWYSGIVIVVF